MTRTSIRDERKKFPRTLQSIFKKFTDELRSTSRTTLISNINRIKKEQLIYQVEIASEIGRYSGKIPGGKAEFHLFAAPFQRT